MFSTNPFTPLFSKREPVAPWSPAAAWTPLLIGAFLTACGGGGGGGLAPNPPDDTDPSVTETLEALGIDTQEEPLKDASGNQVAEDYSPLGAACELNKISELVVLGVPSQGGADRLTLWDLDQVPDSSGAPYPGPSSLSTLDSSAAPWAQDQGIYQLPTKTRSGMGADIDGDGREEQVYAHFDANSMWLTIIEDELSGYAPFELEAFPLHEICYDVSIDSADVDGDGDQEVVLGYSLPYQAILEVFDFDYQDEGVELERLVTRTFDPQFNGANLLLLELATGNIDHDPRAELGLVVTEVFGYEGLPSGYYAPQLDGCTPYVLDDVETGLAELPVGPLEVEDDYDLSQRALTGDVDIGDLDADGIDEIVFAGSVDPAVPIAYGTSHLPAKYVLISLDDAVHELESLGSDYFESVSKGRIRWAQVDLVDLEGDHACEVHVNEFVFGGWATDAPWFLEAKLSGLVVDLEGEVWLENSAYYIGPSMFGFAVADFTGNGHQDLAVVAHGTNEVAIWGIDLQDPYQELAILDRIPLDYPSWSGDCNPQLIPVNSDSDSCMLRFIGHSYVMTEPMVVAVLAAAPSIGPPGSNPTQNVDANLTEFGKSKFDGAGSESELSFSASAVIGIDVDAPGCSATIQFELEAEYQHTWSSSIERTTSISYASNWKEDTVLAVVTPYDVYHYLVVANTEKEAEGQVIQLMVPRSPITIHTGREYFNSVIGKDEVQIDEKVLPHTIGKPMSYRRKAEALSLLKTCNGLIDPDGKAIGLTTSQQTTSSFAVSTDTSQSNYAGISAKYSGETTIGVIKVGGSYGAGYGHTWSWSSGSEVLYSGTVGGIDPELANEEFFRWGLYCHWYKDPASGQIFQVLNYWVDKALE